MSEQEIGKDSIKEAVRQRYARAIERPSPSCCGPAPSQPVQVKSSCCGPAATETMKGSLVKSAGYEEEELGRLPADAVQNSFGCGNPLAYAGVTPGQVVLDIGSGAGIDCLIAADKVGPTGRVIGLDMTPEMIERGRQNTREAGVTNVEFRLGDAEKMPVADASVDWVISNCVINLSPDKPAVFREIARVLKPGGRISISDIVAEELPAAIRESRDAWTGCLAGAISEAAYVRGLEAAGLREVRATSRLVYDAGQLQGLFGDSACGITPGACGDGAALAREATGKIWSARFEGVKPYPASTASEVVVELAQMEDLPAIRALLADADLPADVEPHLADFLVAHHAGRGVGCVGMEVRGSDALFRSLVVTPAYRGLGLGRRLYETLAAHARTRGVARAYLLTTTIESLAEAWGFRRIDRAQLPAAIQETSEFRGGYCASAVAMWRDLRKAANVASCCG
ncbi:MAG: arsenite methyltransferase [candidate division NC10 bacterium]|nr:arsenite methyltransferase [candidate division NC10 bacterium]